MNPTFLAPFQVIQGSPIMNTFHQQGLHVPSRGAVESRWLRAIMLSFEALHRQRWSAPWQVMRR
jgi:hypothetical protein